MKNLIALMFVALFSQNAYGTTINFSSTGIKTWPYNMTLSGSNTMNVPDNPPDFYGTISGNISGYGSLVKIGDGELILSGNNTYTGGTYVFGGTLSIESADAFPSGTALTIGGGATVIFNADATLSDLTFGGDYQDYLSKYSAPETHDSANAIVPDPSTITLLISAVAGGLFLRHRKTKRT
jgi:autotransporter-associated beta strand protein